MGLSRRAIGLPIAVLTALVLLAIPAGAFGASTGEIRTVVYVGADGPVDVTQVFVNGDDAANVITLAVANDTYTVTDTSGITAGPGCTQAGTDSITCPGAAAVEETFTTPDGGADSVTGGPGADTILGGAGADTLSGGPGGSDVIMGGDGNDILDSGNGGIPGLDDGTCGLLPIDTNQPRLTWCSDFVDAEGGFDTITYASRTGRVTVDRRPGRGTVDDDGTNDGLESTEKIIGGLASDELVGGIGPDTIDGGPGADFICGGLGKDTVDYSDETAPVSVTLDGALATDPDVLFEGVVGLGARQDCRLTIKQPPSGGPFHGFPCTSQPNAHTRFPSCAVPGSDPPQPPATTYDCVANDGPEGENDCVGEDIENIIGSPHDDVLIGNSPDPLYGQGPRVEPQGENVISGGGGDDLMDGGFGPDVYEGGAGFDAVSYELRTERIVASIDGSANDGSALDRNPVNNDSDQIKPASGDLGVEDIIGGEAGDLLKGDDNPVGNVLLGGPGDDEIQGHGGNDQLGGDEGSDDLEGGEGGDVMEGGPDNDYLFGGFGNDAYDGGGGTDTADFSDATTPVRVSLNGEADDGRVAEREGDLVHATIESLVGGLDDDILQANDGNGTIEGGGGNDLLDGGLGSDFLVGGYCAPNADPNALRCADGVLDPASDPKGNDTASYISHPGPVSVNLAIPGGDGVADENDNVAADVEGAGGSNFDDTLAGDGKLNFINGGPGDDRISGAESDDILGGGLGNDNITGDTGNDTVDGAEGNDTLNGTDGNDTLRGFTGADILDGGAGADTMSGGDGVDTVTYASRSADVNVDTLGDPDDGERNESDQVRTDVESVRAGSGDDRINIADGAAGTVICGGGTDQVDADAADEIGSGCEGSGVRQSSACAPSSSTVRVSGRNATVRLRCSFNARGTVRLRSNGRVKVGKGKARRLNLGSKSFTGKANQAVSVRVRLPNSGRRALRSRKRLRVQATFSIRRDGASRARTNRRTMTLRASG